MADPAEQSAAEQAETKPPRGDWKSLHLWQIQGVRDVLVFLAVLGLLWVGQKTSVVTVPLLLAVLFAYLFEPVICWVMAKLKIQRRTAVISIMAVVIGVVLVPAAVGVSYGVFQLASFAGRAAESSAAVRQALAVDMPQSWGSSAESLDSQSSAEGPTAPRDEGSEAENRNDPPEVQAVWDQFARKHSGREIGGLWLWMYDTVRDSEQEDSALGGALDAAIVWIDQNREQIAKTAASFGAETAGTIVRFLGTAFGLTFTLFVSAFFFFFVATEWVKLKGFGEKLLPDKNRDLIVHLLSRFDKVISGFIRGRLTIAFLQGIVFSIGYFIIGVPGAFILGPIVALLSIVPYLALVGVPISIVLLALSASGSEGFRSAWWWIVGAPTVFYFIGQSLDDYVWTPIIQGKSTGMDTPTILFASLAGGALFGVFGLLIAIPIAACLKILIQEVFWPRFKAWTEGEEKDFLPISRD